MDNDHESTASETEEENPNREQVYYVVKDSLARCHHENGILVKGQFVATYGGGPEGGWFIYICDEYKYLFRVHRTWGTPFVLDKELSGELHFDFDSDGSDYVTYVGEDWSGKDAKSA